MLNNKYILFHMVNGLRIVGDDTVAATIDKHSSDELMDSSMVIDLSDQITGQRRIFPFSSVLYCEFVGKEREFWDK